MGEPSLLDYLDQQVVDHAKIARVAATQRRDAALCAVDKHADADWKRAAWVFLTAYCASHEFVFVDDLWAAGLPEPREARALGPLMQRAIRMGFLVDTGRSEKSVRSNLSRKVIWRSTTYRGAA